MKKYVLSTALGFAILFPTLVGAISLDRSSYALEQTLVIPNAFGQGYRFYNITVPDFVVTINGLSEAYELPADFLIPGDYIVVDTNDPDVCNAISLDECRSNPDYIGETAFSVKTSSPPAEPPVQESSFLGGLGELLGF